MSHVERTGARSLTYSRWHRPDRIRRYLSVVEAHKLLMIDIDSCEACVYCKDPLALIETTAQTRPKTAPITANLARRAGINAYSVAYQPSVDGLDVVRFHVQSAHPALPAVSTLAPADYAQFLVSLRSAHHCQPRGSSE